MDDQHAYKCDLEQYNLLRLCSCLKDLTRWNNWRSANPNVEIWLEGEPMGKAQFAGQPLAGAVLQGAFLEGANLSGAHLSGAHLCQADLKNAKLSCADLTRTDLRDAQLRNADLHGVHMENSRAHGASFEEANFGCFEPYAAHLERCSFLAASFVNANLWGAHLEGADFSDADLRGAVFRQVAVDGATCVWGNQAKVDRRTNFTGVGLGNMRVAPGLKELLEYNARRIGWKAWYNTGNWALRAAKWTLVHPFWWVSDYGRATWQIAAVFLALVIVFAGSYCLVPTLLTGAGGLGAPDCYWHSLYYSFVAMTSLGFSDVHPSHESVAGHVVVVVQAILGYVLLAVLVTRLAILFTSGGPPRSFDPPP